MSDQVKPDRSFTLAAQSGLGKCLSTYPEATSSVGSLIGMPFHTAATPIGLINAIKGRGVSVIVVIFPNNLLTYETNLLPCANTRHEPGPDAVLISNSNITGAGGKECVVVLMGIHRQAYRLLVTAARVKQISGLEMFLGVNGTSEELGHSIEMSSGVTAKTAKYVDVSPEYLPMMAESNDLECDTKVHSAYYSLFLHVRPYMTQNMEQIPLPDSIGAAINAPNVLEPDSTVIASTQVALTLTPAYTINTTRGVQLHTRAMTASAAASVDILDKDAFVALYDRFRFNAYKVASATDELIGHTIAINTKFDVDPDVEIDDLLPLDQLKNQFGYDDWTEALLQQARMVFKYKHSTTFKFGLDVLPLVSNIFMHMGGNFAAEVDRMQHLKTQVTACPYTGLRASIKECMRIGTNPRICYIGAQYYAKCLSDEKEVTEFEKYNTASVANHITFDDKALCDAIVMHYLPSKDIHALAMLLRTLPLADCDVLMNTKTAEENNLVYKVLVSSDNWGEWAIHQANKRRREIRAKFIKEATTGLRQEMDRIKKKQHKKMVYMTDQAAKAQMIQQLTSWERACEEELSKSSTFSDMDLEASVAAEKKIRKDILNQLSSVYTMITNKEYVPDEDPDIDDIKRDMGPGPSNRAARDEGHGGDSDEMLIATTSRMI